MYPEFAIKVRTDHKMNRRKFLKASGLLCLSTQLPSVLAAQEVGMTLESAVARMYALHVAQHRAGMARALMCNEIEYSLALLRFKGRVAELADAPSK
jgi:hypothetical protein